tara:strand:+ start:1872 stop:2261 length:390 start_codon:yes stop_codon:yes gene_type:complete
MPTMTEEKKDCTDELMECTTECDTGDQECHTECIEEYQECDISKEFTAQDVEQCITDGTDYKDCVDHLVATMPHTNEKEDEGDLISELLTITSLLGGQMERKETLNSVGRSSKKIIIEYDIKQRDQGSS